MRQPASSQRRLTAVLVAIGLVALARTAHGQSGGAYSIDWSTVDAGGGASSSEDGRFRVTGTFGQADASAVGSQGGGFEVTGGFWVIRVVTVPAVTTLAAMALGLALMQLGKRRIRRSWPHSQSRRAKAASRRRELDRTFTQ